MAIALEFDGTTSREKLSAAVAALTAPAGAADTGRPVPYRGALERIKRIYEGSPGVGIRSAALLGMTHLSNAGSVIAYMETVATSNTIHADNAVRHLGFDLGPAGVASLKRLYEAGTVLQHTALQQLREFAASKGW